MRWEYKVMHIDAGGFVGSKAINEPALEQKLNQLGGQGWELVAAQQLSGSSTTLFLFKRAVQAGAPKA